ncbi:hypothetical protein DFA_07933 [Cavenderia fasciculata]|uniref:Uncharacterized protein n=1 Tax=Cavenderia fasciculata TaxID=261658 RepID=F4Q438_CACFS|nr:uncharacterized protein DFA_07933 [Cavenderia fasciculata]EGG16952.1 hypothetical protein DFA_07933 [Cavenderia fasciculata]|eukprot:XP_004355426.1 hypothetical protein DFA_07933 [Cavenderia fasciculata]
MTAITIIVNSATDATTATNIVGHCSEEVSVHSYGKWESSSRMSALNTGSSSTD